MKRTMTRLLSVVLSATLATSLFGAPALAVDINAPSEETSEAPFIEAISDEVQVSKDPSANGLESDADEAANSEDQQTPDTVFLPSDEDMATTDDQLDNLLSQLAESQPESSVNPQIDMDDVDEINVGEASGEIQVAVIDSRPYIVNQFPTTAAYSGKVDFQMTFDNRIPTAREINPMTSGGETSAYVTLFKYPNLAAQSNVNGVNVSINLSSARFAKGYEYSLNNIQYGNNYYYVICVGDVPKSDQTISVGGSMPTGDVDGDGNVRNADADLLVQAIENARTSEAESQEAENSDDASAVNPAYDFNADEKLNLVDLMILAENLDQAQTQDSKIKVESSGAGDDPDNPSVDPDTADFAVTGTAQLDSPEDLLEYLNKYLENSRTEETKTPIASEDATEVIGNNDSAKALYLGPVQTGEDGKIAAVSPANPITFTLGNLQGKLFSDDPTLDDDPDIPGTGDIVDPDDPNTPTNPGASDESKKVEVEGVKVTTTGIGKVAAGTARVYYDDENGVEQSMLISFNGGGTQESARTNSSASAVAVSDVHDTAEAADATSAHVASMLPALSQAVRAKSNTSMLSAAVPASRHIGAVVQQTGTVENGVITINFGKKIAIKRVTFTFTEIQQQGGVPLAEISKVEFLNKMEEQVKPPEMNIPDILSTTPGSKKITISWSAQTNVTGYEISVEGVKKGDTSGKVYQTVTSVKATGSENPTTELTAFAAGKKGSLENGVEYTIKVQSVNGMWRSGWSQPVKATPAATKVPTAPENVTITGRYKGLTVSWKAVEDCDTYNLYYRIKGQSQWTKLSGIERNGYALDNLADVTTYEIRLSGTNDIGEGPLTATKEGRTQSISRAELPKYKLINTKDANGRYLNHIESATLSSTGANWNRDDSLDSGNSVFSLFDDNYETYVNVNDWDLGTSYNLYNHGVRVVFDTPQEIGFITFASAADNVSYSGTKVRVTYEDGTQEFVNGAYVTSHACANERRYNMITLPKSVKAKEILVGVNRYGGARGINIAEMHFHGYDSVLEDIMALYEDDAHIQLKKARDNNGNEIAETAEQRTSRIQPQIDNLQTRLNTADAASGEYYPQKATAQTELDYIKQLLADENAGLNSAHTIHSDLADSYDNGKNLGINGLNSWQPLGYVAGGGQQIIVYVDAPGAGSLSKIDLYVGQYHGESNMSPRRLGTFKTGRTVFTVPTNCFATPGEGVEAGGQLYAAYTGNNPNEKWQVRILNAESIPTLDLFGVTDDTERQARVEKYVADLKTHCAKLQESHDTAITNSTANNPTYHHDAYNNHACVLNSTDIMLDKMMYSVPADRVLAACGGNAANLLAACDGSDQMMRQFYQHKGLMEASEGATGTNVAPNRHLNIRYMTMFAGAFMYAAGNHIGVEYNESANFNMLREVQGTAVGEKKSAGMYFGWGSAHEIGHNINDGRYTYAEVTNNYFAQLCRTVNTISSENPYGTTRFNYDTIYKHVTSSPSAHVGNVSTQLAMYWQLAMAYDNHEVYTLYNNYEDLAANRFFARVDGYARNPSSAPTGTGNVELTLGSEQQNIIRLSCAAAQRDLRDFFRSWGFISDQTTIDYVSQFSKETRALQYGCEDTAHRLEVSGANNTESLAGKAVISKVDVTPAAENGSLVNLTINTNAAASSIHGFEIARIIYEAGLPVREVVGFTQQVTNGAYTFQDDATHLGNRAVQYEVTAIDMHLNRSQEFTTNQVKLQGTGLYKTDGWSIETNMNPVAASTGGDSEAQAQADADISVNDAISNDDNSFCGEEITANAGKATDSILTGNGEFVGEVSAGVQPTLTIDMNRSRLVEHLAYTHSGENDVTDYSVQFSVDGQNWTDAVSGKLSTELEAGDISNIFFPTKRQTENGVDGPDYIRTATARYIKFTATSGTKIAIKQLQVFGPSGDDVEFTLANSDGSSTAEVGIGRLKEEFKYGTNTSGNEESIPAGSIVFTGAFKGNPAYNVAVVYDQAGRIVGGKLADGKLNSDEVILAPYPDLSEGLGTTAKGSWVYWVSPNVDLSQIEKVRVELYRVDDAFTNQGQRLVADTMFVEMPKELKEIELKNDLNNGQHTETAKL